MSDVMFRELKIAIEKEQPVSIHTKDGDVVVGTPESCQIRAKVKLRNGEGIVYLPYEDLVHVMRLIAFPLKKQI
ncbi:hypothetical protein NYE33_14780 [Paenibacillus sp. FSL R10-2199]|uniref:hypothetical protein n=1 Tax=Paenibacillus sp. FSL R10-2199 TaxID=2975348 RepID=UPI0030F649F3